jgi:hypothetical protein
VCENKDTDTSNPSFEYIFLPFSWRRKGSALDEKFKDQSRCLSFESQRRDSSSKNKWMVKEPKIYGSRRRIVVSKENNENE